MLNKDLLHIGSRIVIEGTKAVTFGAGITLATQATHLLTSGDVKSGKALVKALDISLKTLIK